MRIINVSTAAMSVFLGGVALAASPAKTQFTLGVDVPYLAVTANHGVAEGGGSGNAWFEEGFDDKWAYRINATAHIAEEFGVRARFFGFDSDEGIDDGDADPDLFFNATMWDLEGTASLELAKWNFILSAGIRGAKVEWSDEDGGDDYEFDGTGFTVGFDMRRNFGDAFVIFAGVRHSQIMGETTEIERPEDSNTGVVLPITEFKVGAEYTHAIDPDVSVTLGLHYEATLFSSLSGNVDNDIDPEDIDVSLTGPAVSLRMNF